LDGDQVVAGVGMMKLDWPSHPLYIEPLRGYILNVYTEPAYRGRGLATHLMKRLMGDARKRKISVITLHATEMGRPVYEKLGFHPTGEVRLVINRSHEDEFR
jgi:ribosomal protein S18 acetylase RimI-like enzyme